MNKLGSHALVWVGGWSPDECRSAVESTKEAGYDLIEIPLLDPSSIDVADTAQVLERVGIGATCSLGLGFDTDISSDDPAIVARGSKLLDDALLVVRDLGSPYWRRHHRRSWQVRSDANGPWLGALRRRAPQARRAGGCL